MREGRAVRHRPQAPRQLLLGLALVVGLARPAAAQPTNAETIARLAADCLAVVPPASFALDAPSVPPYVRTALIERWQAAGRRVYAGPTEALPRLTLDAPRASVVYARVGRQWGRVIGLQLPYTLTGADGEMLRSGACDDAFEDVVDRRRVAALETPAYPETVGARPAPGWVRRYAEPLVLGSAVVVSTLLFFSLRSR